MHLGCPYGAPVTSAPFSVPFITCLSVLSIGALPPGSFHGTWFTISEAFLDMFLGVPIKGAPLQVPLTGPLYRERFAISRAFFYISLRVCNEQGLLLRIKSYLFLKVPGKGAPPPQTPQSEPSMERDAPFWAFFYISLYPKKTRASYQAHRSQPHSSIPSVNQTSPGTSIGAMHPVLPGFKNSHIKLLQIMFRLHGVTSHSKNGLRLEFYSRFPLCCSCKRYTPFPELLVY